MYQILTLLGQHAQFRSLSSLVRHLLLCIFSLSVLFYFFSPLLFYFSFFVFFLFLNLKLVQSPESRVQSPGSSPGSRPGFILCLFRSLSHPCIANKASFNLTLSHDSITAHLRSAADRQSCPKTPDSALGQWKAGGRRVGLQDDELGSRLEQARIGNGESLGGQT